MMLTNFMKVVGACAIAAVVAGCGGSSATISAENPDDFAGRVTDGAMSGVYNPVGYSSDQVRNLVSQTCEGGRLTGFNAQPAGEGGLPGFAATCPSWKGGAGLATYERRSGSDILIEITGSDGSGNVTFTKIEARL